MKRKDCFFGLHFDFHANGQTTDIGKNFDAALLDRIITETKPDFIQCDTKGHPGISSYATAVGYPSLHLCKSLLHEWRAVTEKRGVPLFSHYSGLWDMKCAEEHPDWAAVYKDGSASDRMSVFGGYCDNMLIPQLKEIAGMGVDGVWVDGECWAQITDYGDSAKRAFKARYGLNADDLTAETFKLWLDFQREGFLKYVAHYVNEVKAEYPHFEITSNWLNTAWMPVSAKLTDYISGDLSPTNSVDSARFDGRVIRSVGRNWDLMAWGISYPVHHVKGAVQLMQEAAVVIALGGGFQIYNIQSAQNTVADEWAVGIWKEVSEFVRSRREFCHNASPVPDVGVLYSPKAYFACMEEALYCRDNVYNKQFGGVMLSLCDAGRNVSAVHAERVSELDLSAYKAIAVTDFDELEDDAENALLRYAANGGQLLVIGKKACKYFAGRVGLQARDGVGEEVVSVRAGNCASELRCPYAVLSGGNTVSEMNVFNVQGSLQSDNPPPTITPGENIPSCVCAPYGKGSTVFVPLSYGQSYLDERTYELSAFVNGFMAQVRAGEVSVNRAGQLDVVVTRKGNSKYIHLINLLGEHRSGKVKTFNSVPAVNDVRITVLVDKPFKEVLLQPQNTPVGYVRRGAEIEIVLDKVELYTIIEIRE